MKRLKVIIKQLFVPTRRKLQGGHAFRICPAGNKGICERPLSDVLTKEGRRLFQFIGNLPERFTVPFVLALSHMSACKGKPMVYIRKLFACGKSAFRCVMPLRPDGLTPMPYGESGMADNLCGSAVSHMPDPAQKTESPLLVDISQFHGIMNIHSFNGFNSFYHFFRQTFFHNRYILVTGKDKQKENTLVYNLSINKDESYIIQNGIVHNCRCTVERVRQGKYPESDEFRAMLAGSQATAGKHQEMMRFNPGKQMACFPFYNPYTISRCKDCPDKPGMLKLAKIPDNELCAACRVIKEMMKAKETLQKQRKTVREWAKENLVGRTIVVQGVQKTIEFTMNGIKETLNQPHKHMLAKNEAIRDIVSLLENSEHVLERMDDKGNPMVLKYHYLKIEIAEKESYAVIRELMDGKCQFYSIVEKLKKKDD